MFMEKITETAYAKINLGLDVLGKRADGYHEVSMVMQSISLADTVTLEKHSGWLCKPAAAICRATAATLRIRRQC